MKKLEELAEKAEISDLVVKIDICGKSISLELESFDEAVIVFKNSGKMEIADFLINQAIDFVEKYN